MLMFHLQDDQRTERCIPLYRVQACYTNDSVSAFALWKVYLSIVLQKNLWMEYAYEQYVR